MSGKKKVQVISFQPLSANSGAGMARLGYYVSQELQKRGLLKNFIVHSKGKFTTHFPSVPVSVLSRYYLFIINAFNRFIPLPTHRFRFMQEYLYDWFCRFRIKKDTTVIFTTNAFLNKTFTKAKKLGIIIVLLPGTPEENYIYDLVSEENRKLNISSIDAYTYKKRVAYFNQSLIHIDKVVGSLPTVFTSYSTSPVYKGEIIKLLGHMTPDFKPAQLKERKTSDGTYNVGYLAHTVVLKGLQYLMEAWAAIMADPANDHMHLHIAGSVDQPIQAYLDAHYRPYKNVKFVGHITDASTFLREMDVFVVPSLIDGAPITALEAAHNAVPVIITDNCGSAELLGRGDSGCWTIPIRDAAAIKDRIVWAEQHREEATVVGKNAKHNLDNYSMEAFIVQLADYLEHKA